MGVSLVPVAAPVAQHDIPDAVPPERFVYVIQNVVGDARGATGEYLLTTGDGAQLASLPVELREGRFNITEAFGGNPLSMAALDAAGNGRVLTLEVSGLPSHCKVAGTKFTVDVLTGCDAEGRVVFEAEIVCDEQT